MQDNSHGSFVAGLIANGRLLNHNDLRFPSASARIVDVVAFDRDGQISEEDLLAIIDDALVRYPNVKIWNMSLSMIGDPCKDLEVSEIAHALHVRAHEHKVLFVVPTGNFSDSPYRSWPPEDSDLDDRVHPPADCFAALTVGGLAHVDTASTVVRREDPAPFTRRGPAAVGLLSPQLTHYAGNCDQNGQYVQTGIISVDGAGHIAESVGVSFACPLVSVIAANVHRELDAAPDQASPVLTKAMTIHSAFVRNKPLQGDKIHYHGVGCPGGVREILNCSQSEATIVMQVGVRPKPLFEKRPFPMPNCLIKDDRLQCELFMTLLYDCPVDRQHDLEYCRTNVKASLGP